MLALPIFPVSHPTSIFGECELNFCVRDGNRWTLTPINTNIYSVTAKLQHTFSCMHPPQKKVVTRTGFEPMLTA